MGRAALFSFLLHLMILLLTCFGLPWSSKPKVDPFLAIPVEMVTLDKETRAPNPSSKAPKEKPKPAEKPIKPIPEKPKPPTVQDDSPEKNPEPETKPDLKPLEENKIEPITEPIEDIPAPTPKPTSEKSEPEEPRIKPTPPKPTPPKKSLKTEKKDKKNKKSETFDALLKNLDDLIEDSSELVDKDQKDSNAERHMGQVSQDLTASEKNLFNSHFQKCWNIAAGAEAAEDLAVRIRILVNRQGEVQEAQIVDKNHLNDPYYRIAAEKALRAVKDPRCIKLPLPLDKYEAWKDGIIFNFDPKHLLEG